MSRWIIHASFAVFCLVVPASVAYRSGRFGSTWRAAWLALAAWFGIMAMVVGPLLEESAEVTDLIPDGPAFAAALLMGWLPAVPLAGVALVLARVFGGRVSGMRAQSASTEGG